MSLVFALLALAALSLGSVALLRSLDTGTQVLGNLGFKQDATVSADAATESAITWLTGYTALTDNSSSAADKGGRQGYYASSHEGVDITGQQSSATRELIDWDGNRCANVSHAGLCALTPYTLDTANGVTTQYVIFRLCNATGMVTDDAGCLKPTNAVGSSTKRGKLDYGDYARFSSVAGPYYRIVVRSVSAARQTTSFTETIVHF
jgi:type IV pilus assembly protein PilX